MTMLARMRRYITQHRMLAPGDRVGVAVSGGADSVCLLRLLLELRAELGLVLHVVHFDHCLRDESTEEARWVEALAKQYDLAFHTSSAHTRAYATEHGCSIETAAREVRYTFFDELLTSRRVAKIATGHTLTDQAETVMMKLLRGAGTSGLSGIHPVLSRSEGAVVRPLLFATRADVENHLRSLGQSFCEDASNADPAYTRNRVRHRLMPILRELNPEADIALAQTAEILRADDESLQAEAVRALPFVLMAGEPVRGGGRAAGTHTGALFSFSLEQLTRHPLALQRRIVRLGLRSRMTPTLVETDRVLALAESALHAQVELAGGVRVRRLHRELQFFIAEAEPVERNHYEVTAVFDGAPVKLSVSGVSVSVSVTEEAASLTAEPLALPIKLGLRPWRAGDRFQAPHTRAPKKVKEHLAPLRLTPEQKSWWPVLEETSRGEILWVKGLPARRFAVRGRVVLIAEEPSSAS